MIVQGNHCMGAEHCTIEAHSPATTSPARVGRMQALVGGQQSFTLEDLQQLLSDTEGGADAISRDSTSLSEVRY